MKHDALKSQINSAASTAATQRREATQLLGEGRQLRKSGNQSEGWDKHREGMALRWDANDEREYRRHLHLSAALLNGRTYKRCEAKYDEEHTGPASAGLIGPLIEPYLTLLPEGMDADDIAAKWLHEGDARLRYDKATESLSMVKVAEPLKEAA